MIYLDNAATSFPKAPGVAEAMAASVASLAGNPGRSGGPAGLAADRLLLETREALAALIGGADPARIVLTKNATEALNLVILGLAREGATAATTNFEHNAVTRPLASLAKSRALRLVEVGLDESGRPEPASLAEALAARPSLAVLTMASNVTGAVTPWAELARAFRAAGALVCLDASQYLGHAPLRLGQETADFLCFPGHKGLLGPAGTGGLYCASDVAPEPLLRGGTGSRSADSDMPEGLPERLEAGTQNLPGAAGLLAAARWLAAEGLEAVAARERALCDRLLLGIGAIGSYAARGPGPGEERVGIVSLTHESLGPAELARALEGRGIAARAGLHCAPAAHRSLGTLASGGTLRLSPGPFTGEAEIDEAVEALEDVAREARG